MYQKIYSLLLVWITSTYTFASNNVEEITCVSINDQVALNLNSNMDKYIVTNDALTKNKCPAEIFYSIKNAKETDVDGWKVFYGAGKSKSKIEDLLLENKALFLKRIEIKSLSTERKHKFNTFQINADLFVKWSEEFCGVYLAHDERAGNVDITLSTVKEITTNDFCYSIPTILAVNDLKIIESDGLLKITMHKNP